VEKVYGNFCPLSFAKVTPEPEDPTRDGSVLTMDQYSWRCENWGTKWDIDGSDPSFASNARVNISPGRLVFLFDTAWSPCLPVMDSLAKNYPQLCIDHIYSDEAVAFAGRAIWKSGELVFAKSYREESPEFSAVIAGRRLEEVGRPEWAWEKDFPVLTAQAKIMGPRRSSQIHTELEGKVLPRSEALALMISSMRKSMRMASGMMKEIQAIASELNFPLDEWKKAGFSLVPELAWNIFAPARSAVPMDGSSPKYRMTVVSPHHHRLGTYHAIGLTSPAAMPSGHAPAIAELGMIVPVEGGFDLLTADDWSVSAVQKDPETGLITVKKSGLCQTPPSGRHPSSCWKVSQMNGEPYLAAAAHCSGGKLWDPSRSIPSFSEWNPDGSLAKTASFFDGRYSTGSSLTSVKKYQKESPLPSPSNMISHSTFSHRRL